MANYNTFIVVDCNSRKSILTTSSARKANGMLATGYRLEQQQQGSLYLPKNKRSDEAIYSSGKRIYTAEASESGGKK